MNKTDRMGKKFLSNLKLYSDYLKWKPEKNRYENWDEACEDIIDGHRKRYQNDSLNSLLDSALESMKDQSVLASQRNLQFRHDQIMAHNSRMFNCLSGDTKFITDVGVFSFEELGEGAEVNVWTHKGRWKKGIVKKYGKQKLNEYHFTQGVHGQTHVVKATENHRWILKNGEETTNLKIGDNLQKPCQIFDFKYEDSNPLQRLYWCYGYVYGDGTKVRDSNNECKYSMVRLCGDDVKFLPRFEEMGFKNSRPLSLDGDVMVYTGKYQKTLPDIEKDGIELIKAFVSGYLDADGEKNRNNSEKLYNSIQCSNKEGIDFIRKVFPSCGIFISQEYDKTGEETNFGIRPETVRFTLTNSFGSKYNKGFCVSQKIESSEEDVWCLEVEDDKSFTLSNGIVTGNCTVLHFTKADFFQKIFYLGLCGCGVGVSLLKPFIACLPSLSARNRGTKTFVIEDSIEGWADALGVLISSYLESDQPFPEYAGYEIRFDYSLIREKGAYISGGFKAPGPDGLKESLEIIEKLIEQWMLTEGNTFRPILVYDIICHASDAVLSGGVRRSALSMIVDPHDMEMIEAKLNGWRDTNPQRGRSNNSVLIPRNWDKKDFFEGIVKLNEGASDIGFVFCNTWFDVFNPCYTKNTRVLTSNGWKTFGEIIDLIESGEIVYVAQDKRITSELNGLKEEFDINLEENGVVFNPIQKVGLTGKDQDVYRLELSCGREVELTGNHKIATTRGMIEARDLKIGKDQVLIGLDSNVYPVNKGQKFEDGFIAGLCIGDGFITDKEAGISVWFEEDDVDFNLMDRLSSIVENCMNSCTLESKGKPFKTKLEFKLQTQVGNQVKYTLSSKGLLEWMNQKKITKDNLDWIHNKDKNFQAGLISGLFFADGHVDFSEPKRSLSLRITQSNKRLLQNLMLVLQSFGIMSSVYDLLPEGNRFLPNSRRELEEYHCKASYRLCIPGAIQMRYMIDNILYLCDNKINYLEEILSTYKKLTKIKNIKTVVNLEYIGKQDVYCLEENNRRTVIAEGISAERCFEIGFTPVDTDEDISKVTYDGLKEWSQKNLDLFGVQMCNLNEINAEKCKTKESFIKACENAAIIGTLQAGYTSFPYLGPRTESLVKREALLGVSITGWMNNPFLLNPELLREGAEVVKKTNALVADIISINVAARTTCVKPSGNASVVLGTASGIHPEHSERYFRVMQLNKEADVAKWLSENMPFLLEESVWSSTNTDYVVFVPIVNPPKGLFKKDMHGVKHLDIIRMVQQNWIDPGTREELGIYEKTRHNCSCTVIIDDKAQIVDYLWKHRDEFTAVSFLTDHGDKDFNQAPFTSVLSTSEIFGEYGDSALFASGLIVDALHYFDNNLWDACDHLLDKERKLIGTKEQVILKQYWLKRAKKFARNYFKGDMKTLVYCLKDVHLCHKWSTITRQIKEVNFEEILTKPEYKDVSDYGAMSCSGGQCEIVRI